MFLHDLGQMRGVLGFAALRASGTGLGKADFDGFRAYPAGFRFR